jgi:hypothetical protein
VITIYGKEAIYKASENDKRDKLGKCSVCKETNAYPAHIVCMHVNNNQGVDNAGVVTTCPWTDELHTRPKDHYI